MRSVSETGNAEYYDYEVDALGLESKQDNKDNEILVQRTLLAAAQDSGVLFHRGTDSWFIHGGRNVSGV